MILHQQREGEREEERERKKEGERERERERRGEDKEGEGMVLDEQVLVFLVSTDTGIGTRNHNFMNPTCPDPH